MACLLATGWLLTAAVAWGQGAPAAQPALTPQGVLAAGEAALDKNDRLTAAAHFFVFYERFPASPQAEKVLWRAITLYRQEAEQGREPLAAWEQVRELARRFYTDFPRSEQVQEAYLQIGVANFHLHALREANTYLNLFLERYPRSPLVPQASYWKARTLVAIGHYEEAEKLGRQLITSADPLVRRRSAIVLGELYYTQGNYDGALKVCANIIGELNRLDPEYYEVLRVQGLTRMQMGGQQNLAQGRALLYQYLNVVEAAPRRNEVLFELAESYFRQGDDPVAQELYGRIIASGQESERAVVLSRFRRAQYLDDPGKKLGKWQKRGDLTDPAGDAPFLALLNGYVNEPISQEARYGLFLRYMARNDQELAYQVGKSFLQYGSGKVKDGQEVAGDVLLLLLENLLEKGAYEKVYQLYATQHDYVNASQSGRLQYLVGQALEELHLYDQAAVVYYRALGLQLSPAEKEDLYRRRAAVYIAKKDFKSAARLLKHLRKIYADTKQMGEVYYYSGRLAEAKGDLATALSYYEQAARIATLPERRPDYAEALLRVLMGLERYDTLAGELRRFGGEKWLSPPRLQQWYGRAGETLYGQGKLDTARQLFEAAVAADMPQASGEVQLAHLRLGDIYAGRGEREKGREHYRQAQQGPDPLQVKVAGERLRTDDINRVMLEVGNVLGKGP